MTEDVTSLQIRIEYDKVSKAEAQLSKLNATGTKTEKGVASLSKGITAGLGSFVAMAAGVASVTAAISAMKAIIAKTAEFQKLKAGLETATGSAENAKIAFQALQDYAQSTPSSLIEVTEAFTKLVNYGLTPSERALVAYGNTASAMGKSLNQMVEAVADAATGEFERLKEFGIKASNQGDQITFRFRGVATTVKNTSADIEKYLIELGEKNFAGAMEKQMDTLNGKFSSLGDEWDKLLANIGENGLGDVVGGGIQTVINLLQELNAMIASGELQANLEAWTKPWMEFFKTADEGFHTVFDSFQGMTAGISASGEGLITDLVNDFQRLPLKWKAGAEAIGSIMFALVDTAVAVAKDIYEAFAARFEMLVNTAVITGKAVGEALANPLNAYDIGSKAMGDLANEVEKANARIDKSNADTSFRIKTDWQVGVDGAVKAFQNYNDGVAKMEDANKKGAEARKKYDEEAAKRKAAGGDRLGQFGVGVDTQGNSSGKKKKGHTGKTEWEQLEDDLRSEEQKIQESYDRRLKLIEENTRKGSEYQAQLELSLTDKVEEEQKRRIDKLKQEPETMFQAFAEEEKNIEDSYERRKDIILNATELTEEEKLKLLKAAEEKYTAEMRKHETERNKAALGLAADFFGNLSTIAGAFGKKGAKMAKAAAIVQTTIKTYESATSAYASLAGIPYVGPVLGAAAAGAAIAAGLANIQKIRSQDDSGGYSGAYAIGGLIPPGKFGMVGEAGPELVKGPAMVTSAQATWDRRGGADAPAPTEVAVNIINMSGEPVTQRQGMDGDKKFIEVVIGQVKDQVAADINKGGTKISRAMEGVYNLGRGKRA